MVSLRQARISVRSALFCGFRVERSGILQRKMYEEERRPRISRTLCKQAFANEHFGGNEMAVKRDQR